MILQQNLVDYFEDIRYIDYVILLIDKLQEAFSIHGILSTLDRFNCLTQSS